VDRRTANLAVTRADVGAARPDENKVVIRCVALIARVRLGVDPAIAGAARAIAQTQTG
jgi:hypothetical protein